MIRIDLNCDIGEGMMHDADLMPFITSANIACGYHAGGGDIMKRTAELAMQYDVAIGAHPGFDDKQNFGRKELELNTEQYYELVVNQLYALKKVTDALGGSIHHVKPHGALYNLSAKDKMVASVIARSVKDFDESLILYGLSGSNSITEAKALHLKTASEVFADRTYQSDGSLTSRTEPNALIQNEDVAIQQVLQMAEQQKVTSTNNECISILAETICIHGDGPHAVQFAKRIFQTLKARDIVIKAISK